MIVKAIRELLKPMGFKVKTKDEAIQMFLQNHHLLDIKKYKKERLIYLVGLICDGKKPKTRREAITLLVQKIGSLKGGYDFSNLLTKSTRSLNPFTKLFEEDQTTMPTICNLRKHRDILIKDIELTEATYLGDGTYMNIIEVFEKYDLNNRVIKAHTKCYAIIQYVLKKITNVFYTDLELNRISDIAVQVKQQALEIGFETLCSKKLSAQTGGGIFSEMMTNIYNIIARKKAEQEDDKLIVEVRSINSNQNINPISLKLNPLNFIVQRDEPLCLYIAALTVITVGDYGKSNGLYKLLENKSTITASNPASTEQRIAYKLKSVADMTVNIERANKFIDNLPLEKGEYEVTVLDLYSQMLRGFSTTQFMNELHDFKPDVFKPSNELLGYIDCLKEFIDNFFMYILGYPHKIAIGLISRELNKLTINDVSLHEQSRVYLGVIDSYVNRETFKTFSSPNSKQLIINGDVFSGKVSSTLSYSTAGFVIGDANIRNRSTYHAISGFQIHQNGQTNQYIYNGHSSEFSPDIACTPFEIKWNDLINTSIYLPIMKFFMYDPQRCKYLLDVNNKDKYYEYNIPKASTFMTIGTLSKIATAKSSTNLSKIANITTSSQYMSVINKIKSTKIISVNSVFLPGVKPNHINEGVLTLVRGTYCTYRSNDNIIKLRDVKQNIDISSLIEKLCPTHGKYIIYIDDNDPVVLVNSKPEVLYIKCVLNSIKREEIQKKEALAFDMLYDLVENVWNMFNAHKCNLTSADVTKWIAFITIKLDNILSYHANVGTSSVKKIIINLEHKEYYLEEFSKYVLLICIYHFTIVQYNIENIIKDIIPRFSRLTLLLRFAAQTGSCPVFECRSDIIAEDALKFSSEKDCIKRNAMKHLLTLSDDGNKISNTIIKNIIIKHCKS